MKCGSVSIYFFPSFKWLEVLLGRGSSKRSRIHLPVDGILFQVVVCPDEGRHSSETQGSEKTPVLPQAMIPGCGSEWCTKRL
jgi:hypothetical protein